jgi:hypothetical protein
MAFSITVDTSDVQRAMQGFSGAAHQLVRIAGEETKRWAGILEGRIKTDLTNRKLRVRSNLLRGSVSTRFFVGSSFNGEGTLGAQVGIVQPKDGKVLNYAALQEFGATVRPVNAQVLTIPLAAALTGALVQKFTALGAKQYYDRTFWKDNILFGVKVQKGRGKRKRTGRYGQAGDKQDKLVPLFVGVKSATIPGKSYLRDNAKAIASPFALAVQQRVMALLTARDYKGVTAT